MGGNAPYCASGMDAASMIRALFIAALLVVFGDSAFAGPIPYKFNGINVVREGGVTYLRGTQPTPLGSPVVSGTNLVLSGSASVSNQVANFTASTPIAASAALVAVNLLKTSPTTFAIGAVLTWMAQEGMSVSDGQVVKASTGPAPVPTLSASDCVAAACSIGITCSPASPGFVLMCQPGRSGLPHINGTYVILSDAGANAAWYSANIPTGWSWGSVEQTTWACSTGFTYDVSTRRCVGQSVPPTQSDWDNLAARPLSPEAAWDIIKNGGGVPINSPTFSPGYRDLTIGDPYVDPVTGKRYQDNARVTPQSSDPSVADVQVVKQEIDANGQPVVDPATSTPVPPQEKEPDPCTLNPDRVGCKDLGTVDDVQLQTQERGVASITVQSFNGNDTCPAAIPLPKGASLSWDYPCQLATGVKPFLLALAWLAAGLIVIGAVRET